MQRREVFIVNDKRLGNDSLVAGICLNIIILMVSGLWAMSSTGRKEEEQKHISASSNGAGFPDKEKKAKQSSLTTHAR